MIAVCQFLAELLVMRNYFLAQVFITPMALVGISLGTGLSGAVMYDRVVETLIGCAVGMLGVLLGSWFGLVLKRKQGLLPKSGS
ncbi:FUSC family protein [Glutamicibacter halophytocola]|uniref:FUSC family protein n=1 Tax=Glutamicibacter halophytocola TaxID=1933880 RepID=UPI003218E635